MIASASTAPPAPIVEPTANFRRQHEELFALALEIQPHLDLRTLSENAGQVRRMCARFGGKLLVHAEMENLALYPALLHHADDAVREQAQALYDEVKHIYALFHAYTRRWPAEAIAATPSAFVRETRDVFKVLGKRMARENDELYPLVDRLRAG